jgi:putative membrane protein
VQAQSQNQSPNASQSSFIQKAAEANLTEAELGKLAAQKSQNSQIKQFADHLQMDHQSANQKLQPIAQSQGVQIPQSLDFRHRSELNRLEKLSGAEFDREFATTALRDHARTIALFQKEAQQGHDTATKQYAEDMLPALQHHLDMAKDTAKSVGVKDSTISSILNRYPASIGGASTPGGQQQGTSTGGKRGY